MGFIWEDINQNPPEKVMAYALEEGMIGFTNIQDRDGEVDIRRKNIRQRYHKE